MIVRAGVRWLTVVAAVLVGGCGSTSEELRDDNAGAVNQLLTDEIAFEGGTVISDALPATTNGDVQIEPLESTLIVSPSQSVIMALSIRSPVEDTDPITATVVRFGDSPQHVSVTRAMAENADIENNITVGADICATLCKRTYTVTVVEAAQTTSGEIGAHSERSITLDCTGADVPECSGEDSETSTDVQGDPPAGSAGSAQWTAMLLAEIRTAASEGWQQAQGCETAPEQNGLADSAAADLIQIGIDVYSSDDFQSLGPDPISGTWQSITFSEGEESMTAEAARGYGSEVTVTACGSTSLGIDLKPQGGRFVAALVWLQCIQCGDVCASSTSASCQATGAMP